MKKLREKGLEILGKVNWSNIIILILTMSVILFFKIFGFSFIYSNRPYVEFLTELIVGSLSFVKIISIIRYKGIGAFYQIDSEFLGIIGQVALKGLITYTMIYTGFTVSGLIIMHQFYDNISEEGTILVLLVMFYLFIHGIMNAIQLAKEVIMKQLITESKIETNNR